MTAEGEVDVDGTSCYECCASCGIAEIDDIKLMECDGCDLVRYCSDECRENHTTEHHKACKKRAAELRDELLFKVPESSPWGDCPICSLPLPLYPWKSGLYNCCSKKICNGCSHANQKREIELRLQHTCPFCREPIPKTDEECGKLRMKRIEMNDPVAITAEGAEQHEKGNYSEAIKYFTKAAELGDIEAHSRLAYMHQDGEGVEEDQGKEIYHLEKAAIGGHPHARYLLGRHEYNNNNNLDRAIKHTIIAATQGHDEAIKTLMSMFKDGLMEKEVLAATLRAQRPQ